MATDGGPRAWAFLRRNPAYRAECRRALARPGFEPGPFPVRVQSKADGQARAWGLLAWEDPDATDGPASPFWAEAPMLEADWAMDPPPLRGFLAGARTRVEGLRLVDGAMILKIENGGAAAQVRIPAGRGVAVGARLVLRVGFGSRTGRGHRAAQRAEVPGEPCRAAAAARPDAGGPGASHRARRAPRRQVLAGDGGGSVRCAQRGRAVARGRLDARAGCAGAGTRPAC